MIGSALRSCRAALRKAAVMRWRRSAIKSALATSRASAEVHTSATSLRNACVTRLLGSDRSHLRRAGTRMKARSSYSLDNRPGRVDLLRLAQQAERISWPYTRLRDNRTGPGWHCGSLWSTSRACRSDMRRECRQCVISWKEHHGLAQVDQSASNRNQSPYADRHARDRLQFSLAARTRCRSCAEVVFASKWPPSRIAIAIS